MFAAITRHRERVQRMKCTLGLVFVLLLAAATPAQTQQSAQQPSDKDWPNRPVTIVYPFAPGGADGFVRHIARMLSDKFGQPFLVEARSGAGGAVGLVQAAKAPPDGYTLVMTYVGPAVLNKLLSTSIPYDPDSDFEPVILLSETPQVIVSDPRLGLKTLADLVAYGKNKTLTIGHSGAGTMGHLAAALFAARTGVNATLIGYRGATPAITDVLGGQITAAFPAYVPPVATVTQLAVTSPERVGFLPEVPTARESGVDVVATTWGAMVGPARMPRAIVAKLNAALNEFLRSEEGARQLNIFGMTALGGPPERVTEIIARDKAKWGPIIREANIKLD
jgi:tripartite-type tricarboxylate transporter receptor subunit TctC